MTRLRAARSHGMKTSRVRCNAASWIKCRCRRIGSPNSERFSPRITSRFPQTGAAFDLSSGQRCRDAVLTRVPAQGPPSSGHSPARHRTCRGVHLPHSSSDCGSENAFSIPFGIFALLPSVRCQTLDAGLAREVCLLLPVLQTPWHSRSRGRSLLRRGIGRCFRVNPAPNPLF
jgi:hypothetical protein